MTEFHQRSPGRSSSTLALVSLAHGINHAQSALKPLIYPIALREFGVGYGELGIMLGVASAVGGLLQLVAGALGTMVRRHLLLGFGNAAVGISVLLVALAQNFGQFFLWNVAARVGGAAQHPVGSSLLAHHFSRHRLGLALATHFSAGNIGTAAIPLVAALIISLWGWRITTALFAIPAILVGLAICAWLQDPRHADHHESHPSAASFWRQSWQTASSPRLRWILIASIVASGGSGHGTLSIYIPLYLTHSLGMQPSGVGFIFSLLMIGSIVGPLLGAHLVDRFNRQRVV
ncbi:MAG: MFS transporter, partial [Candidatus Binatia bacterium]